MKVIKFVIEPSDQVTGAYNLSVAIESRPGYWKAYAGQVNHWPTQTDAEHVANTGAKIYEQSKAERVFGTQVSGEYEY